MLHRHYQQREREWEIKHSLDQVNLSQSHTSHIHTMYKPNKPNEIYFIDSPMAPEQFLMLHVDPRQLLDHRLVGLQLIGHSTFLLRDILPQFRQFLAVTLPTRSPQATVSICQCRSIICLIHLSLSLIIIIMLTSRARVARGACAPSRR